MMIFALIFATVMMAAWLILLGRVDREDWVAAAYSKAYDNFDAIGKLYKKERKRRENLSRYKGIAAVGMRIFYGGSPEKVVMKLKHDCERIQSGDFKSINIFSMPGYVLQREFVAIGKGGVHKLIMAKCYELYGKKYAAYKAKSIFAKLLSYPAIGASVTLASGALVIGMGNTTIGTAIIGIGTALVLVLTYAIYDELNSRVNKRRAAISKQFPGVVSKLALLVTSGMIMDRAWKETAYSQETELYLEMRKASEELDNLVSPEAAYGNFINRCNIKETAKLASAIMQNLSKGNAEIGKLLRDMAREAWQERRHAAKRDAEKANSKLMIPTMLLFIAILVMLMVPVAMNFSGI